jgi:hypothetical protein
VINAPNLKFPRQDCRTKWGEDTIYNNQAIRGFVGIDLTHESSPDATTLLKFRQFLPEGTLDVQKSTTG